MTAHLFSTEGTVEDYEEFLDKYEALLHPNHYHMLTAKHSLMQMLGRTEGYLIQDMPEEMVIIHIPFQSSQFIWGIAIHFVEIRKLGYKKNCWINLRLQLKHT